VIHALDILNLAADSIEVQAYFRLGTPTGNNIGSLIFPILQRLTIWYTLPLPPLWRSFEISNLAGNQK
jgi:hypothetical protein